MYVAILHFRDTGLQGLFTLTNRRLLRQLMAAKLYIYAFTFSSRFPFSFIIASFCYAGQWDACALSLSPTSIFWAADIYLGL